MLFWVLEITKTVMNHKISHRKIIVGSIIGAFVFTIVVLVFTIPLWVKLMMGCGVTSLLLIRYLFFYRWSSDLGKAIGIIVGITIILGGIIEIIWKYIPSLQPNTMGLILMVSIMGGVLKWTIMKFSNKKQKYYCRVKISGHINVFGGLLDTGNGLMDPISKKPVSVISQNMGKQIEDICKPEKLKAIPFTTVGENGVLIGYEIEEMILIREGMEQVVKNPILAIAQNEGLGKNGYDVIIHPQVLENN